MKKSVLIFSMTIIFLLGSMNLVVSQEQPKPKKDTVNIDTDAKPTFYYAAEDDVAPPTGSSRSATTYALVAGVVIVVAGLYYLLKKKKK